MELLSLKGLFQERLQKILLQQKSSAKAQALFLEDLELCVFQVSDKSSAAIETSSHKPAQPPELKIRRTVNSSVNIKMLRTGLRIKLYEELLHKGIKASALQKILDLKYTPPLHPGWGISLSHTQGWGGFVLSSKYMDVGLDIEIQNRVTPQIADRVSTEQERSLELRPWSLWTMKEAAFKCLSRTKSLYLLTDVEIFNVLNCEETPASENFILFEANGIKNKEIVGTVRGLCFDCEGLSLSLCVL